MFPKLKSTVSLSLSEPKKLVIGKGLMAEPYREEEEDDNPAVNPHARDRERVASTLVIDYTFRSSVNGVCTFHAH